MHTEDAAEWPGSTKINYVAPDGSEHVVVAAEGLMEETEFGREIHIPWQPDEVDLARLAHGGSVWLTMLGGVAPHRIEVKGGVR